MVPLETLVYITAGYTIANKINIVEIENFGLENFTLNCTCEIERDESMFITQFRTFNES